MVPMDELLARAELADWPTLHVGALHLAGRSGWAIALPNATPADLDAIDEQLAALERDPDAVGDAEA